MQIPLIRNLAELVFPSRCIGCSQLGISICSACRSEWNPHIYIRDIKVLDKNYPVVSAVQYSPVASRVLLSAKELNIAAADQLLIAAISNSLAYFMREFGEGKLITIPSRRAATRKRGRNFLNEITKAVIEKSDIKVKPTDFELLTHSRTVKDQSALNSKERLVNLSGALEVSTKHALKMQGGDIGPLIIVDDLITTGATLGEAVRALCSAGFEVKGAVTGAVARPLR